MQSCSKFFLYSPKQMDILEFIIRHNVVEEAKRKPLLDVCRTRWAEWQSAYQHFYQAYVFITESLELIGYKWHMEKYGTTYSDWDTTIRSNAQQILARIINFEFIVVFLTVYQCLSHLAGIIVKLSISAVWTQMTLFVVKAALAMVSFKAAARLQFCCHFIVIFTYLLIQQKHCKVLHNGIRDTLTAVRETHRIVKSQAAVKKVFL